MKKKYLMPQTTTVEVKLQNIMVAVSGNGNALNFSDSETGEDGESADSRGGGFWDDDDY